MDRTDSRKKILDVERGNSAGTMKNGPKKSTAKLSIGGGPSVRKLSANVNVIDRHLSQVLPKRKTGVLALSSVYSTSSSSLDSSDLGSTDENHLPEITLNDDMALNNSKHQRLMQNNTNHHSLSTPNLMLHHQQTAINITDTNAGTNFFLSNIAIGSNGSNGGVKTTKDGGVAFSHTRNDSLGKQALATVAEGIKNTYGGMAGKTSIYNSNNNSNSNRNNTNKSSCGLVPVSSCGLPRTCTTRFNRQKNWLRNNASYAVFLALFFVSNFALFGTRLWQYRNVNVFEMMARGFGQCLNLNCALLLTLILRRTMTRLRNSPVGLLLPCDRHVHLHKMAGWAVFFCSVMHTIFHLANFIGMSEVTGVSVWSYLLDSRHGIGWAWGLANQTGLALLFMLCIIVVFSHRCIRKSGYFEVFYFTHLLSLPFWVLLILHGASFWMWLLVPGTAFLTEVCLRISQICSDRGRTMVVAVEALPSNVMKLIIQRPRDFEFRAGEYIYLNIPGVARHEWHPFTISSAPEQEDTFSVHVRAVGGWTGRMFELFNDAPAMTLSKELLQPHALVGGGGGSMIDLCHLPRHLSSSPATSRRMTTCHDTHLKPANDRKKKTSCIDQNCPSIMEGRLESGEFSNFTNSDASFSATSSSNGNDYFPNKKNSDVNVPDDNTSVHNNDSSRYYANLLEFNRKVSTCTVQPAVLFLENEMTMEKNSSGIPIITIDDGTNASIINSNTNNTKLTQRVRKRSSSLSSLTLSSSGTGSEMGQWTPRHLDSGNTSLSGSCSSLQNIGAGNQVAFLQRFGQSSGLHAHQQHVNSSPNISVGQQLIHQHQQNINNYRRYRLGPATAIQPIEVFVDGPYGSPSSSVCKVQHAVLVAAGIGVTPFASLLQSVMYRYKAAKLPCPHCQVASCVMLPATLKRLRKVDFVWVNREISHFEWFLDLLASLEREQEVTGAAMEQFLRLQLYNTGPAPVSQSLPLASTIRVGRPDWDKVFSTIKSEHIGGSKRDKICVFYCGPPALANVLRIMCHKYKIEFRREMF